ncbi:MAG: hypothetical protein M0C28_29165 [Candidatus Moduliflexus flocculans]|nr:hypothetical protein [Candidatus Moduliflexus flocculans]
MVNRLLSIDSLSDNLDILMDGEQGFQSLAEESLIIGKKDTDRHEKIQN